MDEKLIEKIKEEVKRSKSLDWWDKLDAEILLDTALKTLKAKEHSHIIQVLQNLYNEVTQDDYKEVILDVLKKYRREIRCNLNDTTRESQMNLKEFLEQMSIKTDNIPDDILNYKLSVAEDDGMGYSPRGFRDVIDAYLDEDSGEIRIWI